MRVNLEKITLGYVNSGNQAVINDLSVNFRKDEFVAILGPSGCGKTSLLKAIAGLLPIQSGHIDFPDFSAKGKPSRLMAFQDHCLFPWMNVVDNIGIGLEAKGHPRAFREARAINMLKTIGLVQIAKMMPHELSGGMKQRVSLLRLLVSDGDVLLFDEPLSAIDAQTRLLLQQELLDLWSANPKTSIYVTHDIEEALILADRVIVLSAQGGNILADIKVPLPRPRHATARPPKELEDLRWKIWSLLAKPVVSTPSFRLVAS